MGLAHCLGLRDADVFDGLSLPGYLNKMKVGQPPRRSEADRHFEQVMAEQRVTDAQDRLAMLEKMRARQEALANEPYGERRNRHLDRYYEAELALTERLT